MRPIVQAWDAFKNYKKSEKSHYFSKKSQVWVKKWKSSKMVKTHLNMFFRPQGVPRVVLDWFGTTFVSAGTLSFFWFLENFGQFQLLGVIAPNRYLLGVKFLYTWIVLYLPFIYARGGLGVRPIGEGLYRPKHWNRWNFGWKIMFLGCNFFPGIGRA